MSEGRDTKRRLVRPLALQCIEQVLENDAHAEGWTYDDYERVIGCAVAAKRRCRTRMVLNAMVELRASLNEMPTMAPYRACIDSLIYDPTQGKLKCTFGPYEMTIVLRRATIVFPIALHIDAWYGNVVSYANIDGCTPIPYYSPNFPREAQELVVALYAVNKYMINIFF
jgi:hypothetical protein